MTAPARLLAIHRDPAAVARNHLTGEDRDLLDDLATQQDATSPEFVAMVNAALARRGGGLRVERDWPGTMPGRPWGLVADTKPKGNTSSGNGS